MREIVRFRDVTYANSGVDVYAGVLRVSGVQISVDETAFTAFEMLGCKTVGNTAEREIRVEQRRVHEDHAVPAACYAGGSAVEDGGERVGTGAKVGELHTQSLIAVGVTQSKGVVVRGEAGGIVEVKGAGGGVAATVGGEEGENIGRAEDDIVEEEDFVVCPVLGFLTEEWPQGEVAELCQVRDPADFFALSPARREDPALSRIAVFVVGSCCDFVGVRDWIESDGVSDVVPFEPATEICENVFGVVEATALVDGDVDVVCTEGFDELEEGFAPSLLDDPGIGPELGTNEYFLIPGRGRECGRISVSMRDKVCGESAVGF